MTVHVRKGWVAIEQLRNGRDAVLLLFREMRKSEGEMEPGVLFVGSNSDLDRLGEMSAAETVLWRYRETTPGREQREWQNCDYEPTFGTTGHGAHRTWELQSLIVSGSRVEGAL